MLNQIGISNDLITNLFDGVKFIEDLEKGNMYDIVFYKTVNGSFNCIDIGKIGNKVLVLLAFGTI